MPARPRKLLVTGGAGYIGSHVVKALGEQGESVVVFDNLSTGYAWSVDGAELVVGDLGDHRALETLFAAHRFEAVLHFAASIWVGESVRDPVKYYRNNVANALNLFAMAKDQGVAHVIFSSTAAVYGEPDAELLDENLPSAPINPYGASKMMAERLLQDIASTCDMTFAILRYFNVAGADPKGRIGEATPDNSHLVKIACETALGLRAAMSINGTDYPTADGTCIRDYIHVEDLAAAHVAALDHLRQGNPSTICNCGYGHGQSVREVIDMVREISGVDFDILDGPRRAGDPPRLVASNDKIRSLFGWRPRFDDLHLIVETAWRWEQILNEKRSVMKGTTALGGSV
ncbi:MAG: UDP-glucose 4-epimerase GalE [Alphaproteobacteria bacterium]|nr:UDP-glucose 4-epimerase GalE [Alphaproteobacteria bacterium]